MGMYLIVKNALWRFNNFFWLLISKCLYLELGYVPLSLVGLILVSVFVNLQRKLSF